MTNEEHSNVEFRTSDFAVRWFFILTSTGTKYKIPRIIDPVKAERYFRARRE
ncbi:MAG: hypothetical protein MUO72_02475 [Bacteroidales bacterium]|nr:hypothetical protein [Bacteroidales bacterium]